MVIKMKKDTDTFVRIILSMTVNANVKKTDHENETLTVKNVY